MSKVMELSPDQLLCPHTGLTLRQWWKLVEVIDEKYGGNVTPREVARAIRHLNPVDKAERVLQGMVDGGCGFWSSPIVGRGGPASRVFILAIPPEAQPEPISAPSRPHVYLIQCGEGGPIKIGIAGYIQSRIDTLQTGCPHPLKLLAFISHGGATLENQLHRRFAHLNIHGEWFHPAPELLAFIETECQHV